MSSTSTSEGLPSEAATEAMLMMMGPTSPELASVCCVMSERYSHSLELASSLAPGAACVQQSQRAQRLSKLRHRRPLMHPDSHFRTCGREQSILLPGWKRGSVTCSSE